MATYYLKYFADAKDQQGHYVRVEVHSKTNDPQAPYRMWGLTELNLNVQGGTDKIDSPIIKTSLSFSLVEPPTPSYDYDMDRRHQKRGGWSEFFTPQSDAYKVVLMTGSTYGNWTTRWSGYITPDSWQESLDGYDSVTITARDNIGHLQDFDFDEPGDNGLISIQDLISKAMTKISVPMSYTIRIDDTVSERSLFFEDENGDRHTINEAYINVSLFEGKSWYEVLEQTLESIGWVCRWTDYNALSFMPLRNMPLMGYEDGTDQPVQHLEFYNGGTRTLDPAYKEIKEEIKYDQEEKIERDARYGLSGWSSTQTTKEFIIQTLSPDGTPAGNRRSNAPVQKCDTQPNPIDGWTDIINALNPEDFIIQGGAEGDSAGSYLFVAANLNSTIASRTNPKWNRFVQSAQCKITFQFTEHPMEFYEGSTRTILVPFVEANLKNIYYRVHYSKGGTKYYWNGTSWELWSSSSDDLLKKEYDPVAEIASKLEIELTECKELGPNGIISIELADINYNSFDRYLIDCKGCYARIKSIILENSQNVNLKKNTVTTVNNEAYNIKSRRTPAFSPFQQTIGFSVPEAYKNGMYRTEPNGVYCWPYNCCWDNNLTEVLPFPVQVHKQILQYHHITNEVLEGQAGAVLEENDGYEPIEYPLIHFDRIFYYKGKKHLLLSANLDLLTGRLTSAIFREYLDWDELWD